MPEKSTETEVKVSTFELLRQEFIALKERWEKEATTNDEAQSVVNFLQTIESAAQKVVDEWPAEVSKAAFVAGLTLGVAVNLYLESSLFLEGTTISDWLLHIGIYATAGPLLAMAAHEVAKPLAKLKARGVLKKGIDSLKGLNGDI